jgi:hypothetical protein
LLANHIYIPDKPEYYNFIQNRILWTIDGNIFADNAINWIRDIDGHGVNLTWLMMFSDNRGSPYDHVVDSIFSDTLVFHDNFSDAVYYYSSRVK